MPPFAFCWYNYDENDRSKQVHEHQNNQSLNRKSPDNTRTIVASLQDCFFQFFLCRSSSSSSSSWLAKNNFACFAFDRAFSFFFAFTIRRLLIFFRSNWSVTLIEKSERIITSSSFTSIQLYMSQFIPTSESGRARASWNKITCNMFERHLARWATPFYLPFSFVALAFCHSDIEHGTSNRSIFHVQLNQHVLASDSNSPLTFHRKRKAKQTYYSYTEMAKCEVNSVVPVLSLSSFGLSLNEVMSGYFESITNLRHANNRSPSNHSDHPSCSPHSSLNDEIDMVMSVISAEQQQQQQQPSLLDVSSSFKIQTVRSSEWSVLCCHAFSTKSALDLPNRSNHNE